MRAEVEPQLLEQLAAVPIGVGGDEGVDLAPLRAEAEVIEISLARLATMYTEGELSRERYQRAAGMEERKLARVRSEIDRVAGEIEARAMRAALGSRGVSPELWERLPVDTQQGLYRLFVERIVVRPKPAEPRVHVLWR